MLILVHSPSPSASPRPLRLSDVERSRSRRPRLRLSLPGYAFHMAFGWLLPFSRLLLFSLRRSTRRLSLYLSIVHNYTIRLLNRLMRPLLPAPGCAIYGNRGPSTSLPSLSASTYPLPLCRESPSHYLLAALISPSSLPAIFRCLRIRVFLTKRSLFFPVRAAFAWSTATHAGAF